MNDLPSPENISEPRPYRQVARAAATQALQDRIVDAFIAALNERWIADITLDDIAHAAGTTRQTVIRFFGSKEGLLSACPPRSAASVQSRRAFDGPATPRKVADAALADYEAIGDFVVRMLAQEQRFPELSAWLRIGRGHHRAWIAQVFAPELAAAGPRSDRLLNELIVVYNIYTWKLLRRDFGLSVAETALHLADMTEKLTTGG